MKFTSAIRKLGLQTVSIQSFSNLILPPLSFLSLSNYFCKEIISRKSLVYNSIIIRSSLNKELTVFISLQWYHLAISCLQKMFTHLYQPKRLTVGIYLNKLFYLSTPLSSINVCSNFSISSSSFLPLNVTFHDEQVLSTAVLSLVSQILGHLLCPPSASDFQLVSSVRPLPGFSISFPTMCWLLCIVFLAI